MNWVVATWSMVITACIVLAGIHLLVWNKAKDSRSSLAFAITAVAVAGTAVTELLFMYSRTSQDVISAIQWANVSLLFMVGGLVGLVRCTYGLGNLWIGAAAVGLRLIGVVLIFTVDPDPLPDPDLILPHIDFLGESVTVISNALLNPWRGFNQLSTLLFFIFVIDASIRLWRSGGRDRQRTVIYTGGSIIGFFTVATVLAAAVNQEMIQLPYLISFPFLLVILVVAYELVRDVLHVKTLQFQLADTESTSLLGQLSVTLAHELRQPLGAILRNAEAADLILQQASPNLNELKMIVNDIWKDDQRAGQVITKMSSLLQKKPIVLEPVYLDRLVTDVLTLVRADAVRNHVHITFKPGKRLPLIMADHIHLQQVLLILINNAIDSLKTSKTSDRQINILARATPESSLEICVHDNGPGFSSEATQFLFKAFYTSKEDGVGVGLAVAKTIVEAHQGKIWLDTKNTSTTTLCFTLPVEHDVS